MSFNDWMDSKVKKLNWLDIAWIKFAVAAIALMFAKLWTPLLSLDWYWYGLIGILFAAKVWLKVFKK